MSRPRPLRAAAAFSVAVLLGGCALPLLGSVLADEPAPSCSRGRCCCSGDAREDGGGPPCLRPRCGCGPPVVVVGGSPRIEGVLPPACPLAAAGPSEARGETAGGRLLLRAEAPPVPPPRRPLHA
jgi:hypothetical protein